MDRSRGRIGIDGISRGRTRIDVSLVGRIGADEKGIRIVGNKEIRIGKTIIMLTYIGHSL